MGTMSERPEWLISNTPVRRPTEILVPLVMKVGPVWLHNEKVGRWYAALETGVSLEEIWECNHDHTTKDEAWTCAEREARSVAETLIAGGSTGRD